MANFLNASCAFDYLLKKEVFQLVNGKEWKNTNTAQTAPYTCHFFINKNGLLCLVSFQIIIQNSKHLIKKESVESLLDGIALKETKHIQYVLNNCNL